MAMVIPHKSDRRDGGGGVMEVCGWLGVWLVLALSGCGTKEGLVVYASQDEVYAEKVLRAFTEETGISVRAVYDSEAVKTVGLANRLLAERDHPRCDLFWSNEAVRTVQLAGKGVFRETHGWGAFGFRTRRIVVNTNRVPLGDAPRSLMDLTNAVWRGRLALAYPLFGTTAAHFLALREHWGEARWVEWCEGLLANEPLLVDGNSVVVRMVGRGEAWVGLTDWDDIAAGRRAGLPVEALPLTGEQLVIPNTVGLVKGSSRPEDAERLMDYLRGEEAVGALVELGALEGPGLGPDSGVGLRGDWERMVARLDPVMAELKGLFLE